MKENVSGNLVTETPNENLDEYQGDLLPLEDTENTFDDMENTTSDETLDFNDVENWEDFPDYETFTDGDTVSGSDVRTGTTEYIDYTDLLTSIDSHLETIETICVEQTEDIFTKPFEKYTVTDALFLITLIIAICAILYNILFGK